MARRALSSFIMLWDKHKQIYSDVFSAALQELVRRESLSGDEDAISEILSLVLNQVCFEVSKSRNQEVHTPFWEGPVSPVAEDELKGGKI